MNQLPFMHESYEKHYFELTAINTFMLLTHTNVRVDRETLQNSNYINYASLHYTMF